MNFLPLRFHVEPNIQNEKIFKISFVTLFLSKVKHKPNQIV